jgi:class 3 adenylate cyclase/predicted ATPase
MGNKISDIIREINRSVSKYYDPVESDPEKKAKKQITYLKNFLEALGRYLPQRLVKKVSIEPEKIRVDGERRTVTILFADLTGFTAMSETMDPEDVVQVVNEYFTRMLSIVFKYGGAIDKFMGDAILVVFGALKAHEDDPVRATLAALEMQEAMSQFNKESELPTRLSMSIGINTGPVVAVNVGTLERMEFTIMGDNVNLASRLEGVAEPGQVIISQSTYKKVKDKISVKKLPSVRVKGKKKPVLIYLAREPKKKRVLKRVPSYKTRTKFIDRKKELNAIAENIDKVKQGNKKFISIIGKSGTGKSRLLEESDDILASKGFTVLRGESNSYTSNIPYYTIKEMLSSHFNISNINDERKKREKMGSFISNYGLGKMEQVIIPSIFGLETEETRNIPPDKKKQYIFESIKNLFSSMAENPLCLRLEDLHWADSLSVELLMYLSQSIKGKKILFICTFRPDFALPLIAEDYVTNIHLKNLDKNLVAEYLKDIFEDREPSSEITELVFKHSKGNPLYIEALARNLAKRRLIKRKEVRVELRKSPKQIRVPDTIKSIVMERIDRMDEMDQKILGIASIVGHTFTMEDLTYLLGKSRVELSENLDRLEHFEGEITRIKDEDNQKYRFNTPTVREVIYNSILKERRKELHTKYGNWFLHKHQENPMPVFEILAYHFVNSKDIEKGIAFSKLSGEKARNYFANEAGIKYFSDSLDLLKRTEMTEEKQKTKLEILRRQGYYYMMMGDTKNAILCQKRSLRLANKLEHSKDRAMSLLNIGMLYDKMGTAKKPVIYYKRARREAKKNDLLPLIAMAENNIGLFYKKSGKFKKALKSFNKSLEINRTIGNKLEEAANIENIGYVNDLLGSSGKALENYETAMEMFKKINAKDKIPNLCNLISRNYCIMGDFEKAKKYAEKALHLSREVGDRMAEKDSFGNLGIIYFKMNQPLKAIELYTQALSMAEKMQQIERQMALFLNIGEVFHTVGDFENALEYHRRAKEIAEKMRDHMGMLEATRWLGLDYYYLDEIQKALEQLNLAKKISEEVQNEKYLSYSDALISLVDKNKDTDQRNAALKKALDISREIGDVDMAITLFRETARFFLNQKEYQAALQNASMVMKISQQLGNFREKAWGLYILAASNRELENDEWQTQIDEAKNLAQQISDSYLSSLSSKFNKS